MSFSLYIKLHAFVFMVTSAMLTYLSPLLSKAEWFAVAKYCSDLRGLNVRHFGMVEAMGLQF
jgi:hypothetical protein